MNDRLLELYRGVAVHATANLEHTAALELLALVMAADRKLDQSEIDAIRNISDDWRDGDFTFEKYLGPAIVRAQEAITNDEVIELIDDIDGRINSRVLRRALFSGCTRSGRCRRRCVARRGVDPRRSRRSVRLMRAATYADSSGLAHQSLSGSADASCLVRRLVRPRASVAVRFG